MLEVGDISLGIQDDLRMEINQLKEMNKRYLGKMQEQQDQVAELQKIAGALKDKLQVLCSVDFGEDTDTNFPLKNAVSFDITSHTTYMQEREAFYQNWKDCRNSISMDIASIHVDLTGSEHEAFLDELKDKLANAVKHFSHDQQQVILCGDTAPVFAVLQNDCMIDQTWFMKGSPVAALIKYAEDNYKATAVAQSSKIKFGTDNEVTWWAHDVPYYGRVQLERIKEHGLVEWDIFFNECWQGPFNSKERAIQHLEECIAEKHDEMSNCANE